MIVKESIMFSTSNCKKADDLDFRVCFKLKIKKWSTVGG